MTVLNILGVPPERKSQESQRVWLLPEEHPPGLRICIWKERTCVMRV